MSLDKSTLAQSLEDVLNRKPGLADATLGWAKAYAAYAQSAMSSVSSLPTNAMGNMALLQNAFLAGFNARQPAATAGTIAAGITGFWSAILWVGPTAAGSTLVPGNFALAGALADVFGDLARKSASAKAAQLADAFDAGARQVMVLDVLFAQPAPPVSGPIS